MKVMTYNILGGGPDRIESVIESIVAESPDFLVLNEANALIPDTFGHLQKLTAAAGLSYVAAAPSGQDTYHVLLLSKKPLSYVQFLTPLARAGILAVVDSEFDRLMIVGTHLTPFSEADRLHEVETIFEQIDNFPNLILLGDLNSLSPDDDYHHLAYDTMNETQRTKFTQDKQVRFDVIATLKKRGMFDIALEQHANHIHTAPTGITEDQAHANMRLDYVFVSSALVDKVADYRVIKTPVTETASDHYPVVVELQSHQA